MNPTAGRGAAAKLIPMMKSAVEVLLTEHGGHGVELANEAASRAERLVVVGGDGTLGQVVRGSLGSGVEIGLVPCGTGNDFARHAGISRDAQSALQIALEGEARAIDLGLIRDEPFINVVSCGFDAQVGQRVNQGYKWVSGTLAYGAALLECLRRFKPVPVEIVVDGTPYSIEAALLAVANATSYGGGMRIAPDASVTDGELDLVIVGNVGKLELVQQFPKIFSGKHVHHPKVRCFRFKTLDVNPRVPLPMLLDGDETADAPFTASVQPGALRFVLPPTTIKL